MHGRRVTGVDHCRRASAAGNTVKGVSKTSDSAQDRIIWIDCEMTGLDLERDALIEVAALVTDYELNPCGEGIDVVIRPPEEALQQMGEFVHKMHTESGLLDVLDSGMTMADAEAKVLEYVRRYAPTPRKSALGGNTVGTDRAFLARDMPELEGHLHYRNIDVSSIKELSRRWYPRVFHHAPEKHGGHRALADIKDSVAELRYYREAVFVPAPGPDSPTAKEMGARHAAARAGL